MAQKMDTRERQMKTDDIYENADAVRGKITMEIEDLNTTRIQPSEQTGSDSVRIRSSRAAVVCLVLLCVLLLTAVIVLCVQVFTNIDLFQTKGKNIVEERDQLQTRNKNLTEERDQLLTRNKNLKEERDQLLTKSKNLTGERDQLLTRNNNLTEERDQLLTRNNNLTEERDQLLTKSKNLTGERDQLLTKITSLSGDRDWLLNKNVNLTNERDELIAKNDNLIKQRDQLNWEISLHEMDVWIYNEFSYYYISSEKKSWTESRRYCTDRGGDLIIIDNREEQEFVNNISGGADVWIGLTDSDVEGSWKWVDGSTLTSGFWWPLEPNGQRRENCALNNPSRWADYPCNDVFKWVCEKSVLHYFTLNI